MIAPKKLIFLMCSLTVASLLGERSIAQTEQNAAELTDVCPTHWSRWFCRSYLRLCIAPEAESYYSGPFDGCYPDSLVRPEAWTHANAEEIGQENLRYYYHNCHIPVAQVSRIDVSAIERQKTKLCDEHCAARMAVNALEPDSLEKQIVKAQDDYEPFYSPIRESRSRPLESYGFTIRDGHVVVANQASTDQQGSSSETKSKPSVIDACPTDWKRFSCKFVRLCVSPEVAKLYDLHDRLELLCAECKADENSVSEKDTHSSPHDVGYAAGFMLSGPRYNRTVRLHLWDINGGNLDEALERLVMIPFGVDAEKDYDHGWAEGRTEFDKFLVKARQKAEQMESGVKAK